MRPLPEQRASWLSTILFAPVAFLFALVLGAGFVNTWFPHLVAEQVEDDDRFTEEGRAATMFTIPLEKTIFLIPIGIGVAGATIAGWAWRAPRMRRLKITCFSGLSILILTFFDTSLRLNALTKYSDSVGAEHLIEDMLTAGAIAFLATALGLVLVLTALMQDRRH